MSVDTQLESEVASLLVEALHLEIDPASIDPSAPLFGPEGLGLDSIDALEIAFAIANKYGVQIKSGDSDNQKIFSSVSSLAEFISQHVES